MKKAIVKAPIKNQDVWMWVMRNEAHAKRMLAAINETIVGGTVELHKGKTGNNIVHVSGITKATIHFLDGFAAGFTAALEAAQ